MVKFRQIKAWAAICETSSRKEIIPDTLIRPEDKLVGGFYGEYALMIYKNKNEATKRSDHIIPVVITRERP